MKKKTIKRAKKAKAAKPVAVVETATSEPAAVEQVVVEPVSDELRALLSKLRPQLSEEQLPQVAWVIRHCMDAARESGRRMGLEQGQRMVMLIAAEPQPVAAVPFNGPGN